VGRVSNWPDKLAEHVEAWRHKKFRWGRNDCALFCLNAEKALTGSTRFPEFINAYTSEKGSIAALEAAGFATMEDLVDARLEQIKPAMAGRGDVALISTPNGDALSLVIGNQLAAMGKEGLVFLPLSEAKKAWRV
jgi:hypothetical protein